MNVRQPVGAGTFYEGSAPALRQHALKLLEAADAYVQSHDLPRPLYGGLVPHAGWVYSGILAAATFKALHQASALQTVVLLGADHTGSARAGEVYEAGAWQTPLGNVSVDADLAEALCQAGSVLRPNGRAHTYEHSIEVQVPLLHVLAPQARIVPVMVPPEPVALEAGEVIGEVLSRLGRPVAVVASSDLSHHGGHFPAPGGRGATGVRWTVRNDQRLLELLGEMAVEKVLPEVIARGNACGGGAIAAAMAACRKLGATRGLCLGYTNSYQVVHAESPDDPDDTTVGYASVVFA